MSLGSHGSGIRLVITGHDNDGKGGIAAVSRVGSGGPAADAWQAYPLWGTDKLPKFPDAGQPGSFTTPTPPPGAVGVAKPPATIVLTRMPRPANSRAAGRVMPTSAALVAE
jgi:hypothetical protein